VAVFERNAAIRGFLDGSEIGSNPAITNHSGTLTSEIPLWIGRISSGSAFAGKLDDVRVYNRALTSEEVRRLHDYEFPDADHDGLSDYEEINLTHTNPDKADTENDGLSDYREVRIYGTDPLKPDTDGDGYNDYAEIYAGKKPNDINDHPAAHLAAFTAIELEFISRTNASYYIQASPDLITWTNFEGPILGDGNIWKKLYSTRGAGKLYYRVELAP
jgi:hypothetical protein